MAAKSVTTETIALTERKMDMTLDDIIKMSKHNSIKPNKQQRVPNKSRNSLNNAHPDKSAKVRHYMDTRSSLRQAAFFQRRSSNFQRNQFPAVVEHVRKAVVAPNQNRSFNRSKAMTVNTPRVGALTIQKRAVQGDFVAKKAQQQVKPLPKQRSQTLDSLFASMKEQRLRAVSQQNNTGRDKQQWGRSGDKQQWGRSGDKQQWGRGRFNN